MRQADVQIVYMVQWVSITENILASLNVSRVAPG